VNYWFKPGPPYKRTGPGNASDGKLKFNMDSLDQTYFDWIAARVDTFAARGIYVSIQLFDGWSVSSRGLPGNPWLDHPMNNTNNVNGINGGSSDGTATQSLSLPAVWPIQLRYIKKLLDRLNSYDNVMWEVSNESSYSGSEVWEARIIDTIRAYESRKPKQHPIGFTADWYAPLLNGTVFASKADWISPGAGNNGEIWKTSPPDSGGRKVVVNDTDHLWGNGGDATWVWMSFCRGTNVLYMDGYDGKAYGTGHPWSQADSASATVVKLRKNLGYILRYARRMNLIAMKPHGDLTSTGFCLANPASHDAEYIVYFPSASGQTVNLSATSDTLVVEWMNTGDGSTTDGGVVTAGTTRTFTPPFNSDAALYLHARQTSNGITPQATIPGYHLSTNYPNPFNPSTVVTYDLPQRAHLALRIYSAAGQLVRTLANGMTPAGEGSFTWDGKDGAGKPMSSGTYFCRMTANDYTATVKMILLK
jgi:hypothetical protein